VGATWGGRNVFWQKKKDSVKSRKGKEKKPPPHTRGVPTGGKGGGGFYSRGLYTTESYVGGNGKEKGRRIGGKKGARERISGRLRTR